jgi:hypothetical protein
MAAGGRRAWRELKRWTRWAGIRRVTPRGDGGGGVRRREADLLCVPSVPATAFLNKPFILFFIVAFLSYLKYLFKYVIFKLYIVIKYIIIFNFFK